MICMAVRQHYGLRKYLYIINRFFRAGFRSFLETAECWLAQKWADNRSHRKLIQITMWSKVWSDRLIGRRVEHMDKKTQNIDRTTEDGLCTSCGVCAAVCPVSCIRFERQEETYLPVIDYDKCIRCGKCLRVCPGYSYTYSAVTERKPVCFSVQAKWEKAFETRFQRRSGHSHGTEITADGSTTQHFLYGTTIMKISWRRSLSGTGKYFKGHSSRDIFRYRRRRQCGSSWGNPDEKVILSGQAVQCTDCAMRWKKRAQPWEHSGTGVIFAIRQMTYSIYEYLKRLKRWNSPVKALHFRDKRAGGWPGNIRMEFQNGTHVHLPANERMMVKEFCRQKRCLYCMDKLKCSGRFIRGDNYTKRMTLPKDRAVWLSGQRPDRGHGSTAKRNFSCPKRKYLDIADSQHLEKKLENQWRNNLVFAQAQNGRQVEYGVPCDLLPYTGAAADKAGNRDKARLKNNWENCVWEKPLVWTYQMVPHGETSQNGSGQTANCAAFAQKSWWRNRWE